MVYPVVVVDVDGIRCRALLDTGARSSYASAALISKLNRKTDRREYKTILMMMTSTSQKKKSLTLKEFSAYPLT